MGSINQTSAVTGKTATIQDRELDNAIRDIGSVNTQLDNLSIVPTLQQVTDQGYDTTNPLNVGTSTDGTYVQSDGVAGYASGDQTWGIDNSTGNSNFNSVANSSGIIKPYALYAARLSQSGTSAPTVLTLFENNLGSPIVWTRSNTGVFIGTLAGKFQDGKVRFNKNLLIAENGFEVYMYLNRNNDNSVVIMIYSEGLVPTDGFVADIEIMVYP